jgi:hypothetical protein
MHAPARLLGAAVTLTLAGGLLAAPPSYAAPSPIGTSDGGAWLASQLGPDGLLPGPFGGGDVGVSIDAGFAFLEVDRPADAARVARGVQQTPQGLAYVEYRSDDFTYLDANGTAKTLAFLQALAPARDAVGGVDLVDRLEELTEPSGRVVDVQVFNGEETTPSASTIGQAFAVRGLAAAGSPEAAAARDHLLGLQCPGGGFRLTLSACTDDADADPDVTSLTLLQLQELPSSPAVGQALTQGRAWLAGRQQPDGSWGGGTSTSDPNANSTGLAAWVLGGPAGERGAAWLRGVQLDAADACGPAAADVGAIAYETSAVTAARSGGVADVLRDQWQRASAQALPALRLLQTQALGAAPSLRGPAGFVRAGSRVTVTASGLTAGERLCLTGPATRTGATSPGATWSRSVALPRGTGTRTFTVADGSGQQGSVAVRALGPARLRVTAPARVKRGKAATVVARGLAPGERATVRHRGKVVARATAGPAGNVRVRFAVGRKPGVTQVVVQGHFTKIRSGRDGIRVVR